MILVLKFHTRKYGTRVNEQLNSLPKYMAAMKQRNPDTVVEWLHDPRSSANVKIFKYVFWSFGPCIDAFHKCRPVISVEGTHLR